MSVAEAPLGSLRQARAESSRLAWAFVLSLSLHFAAFGVFSLGKKYHVWDALHLPAWMQPPRRIAELLQPKAHTPPAPPREPPLLFVEVSPEQAAPKPPKEAKYYSNKNAVAANPEATKETDTPKITGTQKQVVKTEDVPRQQFSPLQPTPRKTQEKTAPDKPAPAKPVPDKPAQAELKPKPTYTPGDLVMAKPEPILRKDEGKDSESKPRLLDDPRVREKINRLYGEKMAQDGGVAHHRQIASLDTKETPFGDYDAELIEAISARWYELLDRRDYASDGRGRVVVQFNLLPDGRITDLNIEENNVGEVLGFICQEAIRDPAPYKPWPMEMRRIQGDSRHIQFTFYYN